MSNYKLTVEYDGSCYHGYQIQGDLPTIQACLESAISMLAGEPVRVIASGRTDTGVHALAQVINFTSTKFSVPVERIPKALNSVLPQDIRVLTAEVVPNDFHARFDAKKKKYFYQLYLARQGTAFYRNYAWCIESELDVKAMYKAGKHLEGTHDFAAFTASGGSVSSTVRTIYNFNLIQEERLVKLEFIGNGFLYKMVRNLVGTLVEVGMGRRKPESIKELLVSRSRSLAGITAPPQGLFLEQVWYEENT